LSALQHTLAQPVHLEGIGLHTGEPVQVALHPAAEGCGIVFSRSDHPDVIPVPALVGNVVDSRLATSIGNHSWQVSTIEHLLAALHGLELDNVRIEVRGDELPILDGSARPWVEAIDRAGSREQSSPRRVIEMIAPVEVRDGDRWVRLGPGVGFRIRAAIEFDHSSVGRQSMELEINPQVFRQELGWARTFGFLSNVEGLRRMGLIRGGSLENAVVFGSEGVLNPEGLRAPDEPIRHKILDMLGDLSLVGSRISGLFEAERPGHSLTRRLVEELRSRPSSWKWIE
jgi:UDP-3-O-[3-hydroxymyristoyl] N-acetylglucosamine deacetylase